jgi:hypothetical protein
MSSLREDTDQLFFDFITPAAPSSGGAVFVHPVSVPVAIVTPVLPILPAESIVKSREISLHASSFVTESRVGEIILEMAQFRPSNTIRKIQIVFRPFRATLYSFKIGRGGLATVKFHVSFRRASETVLYQAAQIMLLRRLKNWRHADRSAYDDFVRALGPTEFELPGARASRQVSSTEPGIHRSLDECFNRVNADYFQSKLDVPQLCWSPVKARRILGSYQERNDRLIISKLFDNPKVPLYVLDYLMFHELLHKFLGIGRRGDGKRCMHGKEFREMERQYKYFAQAQAFLKTM